MFEIRNENEVWYKSEEMIMPILYGRLEIVVPTGENKFQIKKFNFEKESYELCNDYTEYEYGGKKYPVTNGEFEIEVEPIPKPEPSKLDKLEENQLALMEAVADQYEEHLQNRINDMEVQASIYEAVLALGSEE